MSRRFASNPSPRHEWRVEVLHCLAELTGHHADLRAWPDGTVPDVLRADPSRRRILVGDAKDAERPTDSSAIVRLDGYMGWLASAARTGATGSFLVCASNREEAEAWGGVVEALLAERGLGTSTRSLPLGPGSTVSWSVVPPLLTRPSAARARGC